MRNAVLAAAVLLGACGGDDTAAVPDARTTLDAPDAFEPTWWHPAPGETKNWDIQLAAPFDVSAARQLYILDLFAITPGGQLAYADQSTVTVPPGPLAGQLAALHARTPRPIVICAIGTGTIRLTDPDARKLPGYESSPPDRPTAPAPGSVIGWSARTPDERRLDIRAGTREAWIPLLLARYQHAAAIGCDGIMPDGNDARLDSGFTVTVEDQTTLYQRLARATHALELSVGQRKNVNLAGQTDVLVADYDWIVPERCAEAADCGQPRPYLNQHKAVFAIDYQRDATTMTGIAPADACPIFDQAGIEDGIVKDASLTAAFSFQCP